MKPNNIINILEQGDVEISSANITKRSKDMIYVHIELNTKYCELDYRYDEGDSFGIGLQTTERTPYKIRKIDYYTTKIEFNKKFKDFKVCIVEVLKYSCEVLLVRKEKV